MGFVSPFCCHVFSNGETGVSILYNISAHNCANHGTVFSFGKTKDQRRKRQFTIPVKMRKIYLRELKINKALVIDI